TSRQLAGRRRSVEGPEADVGCVRMMRPAPTPESARISSIDVLRGFAVLGILVMNVQSFAMPSAAYSNPTTYGDLSGANLRVWAIAFIASASANDVSAGISMLSAPPEDVAQVESVWKPPPEAIAAELAAYRGGWIDQLPLRSGQALYLETSAFVTSIGPDILGRILIGVALYKLGIFSARRSRRFYLTL